ncbi:MAG: hypothetical protein ACREXT_06095 [Gammaproteobacteria bacterium]
MYDPSEAAQDRVRRLCMNIAFVVIVALNIAQWRWLGVRGVEWLSVVLLAIAAAPQAMLIKLFELRFKMSREERLRALRELPARKKAEFAAYGMLAGLVFIMNLLHLTWALVGIWLYDFVTYYHDRPERMRHLYAVTKTLDEFRGFPAPWAWPLPAIAFEILRRFL